jgi:hypothetical protein
MALHVVRTTELDRDPRSGKIYAYIANWIRNPDPGSKFDQKTKYFRWLWMPIVIRILFLAGYEGILFIDDNGTVVGHVFYQKHGDAFKVFSWYINEGERGAGLMTMMTNTFFEHARNAPHVTHVWVGAGGNERIARFWEKIDSGDIIPTCGLLSGKKMGLLIFPDRYSAA